MHNGVFIYYWFECRSIDQPTLITALSGKNVVYVTCGNTYSAAITEEGALYTWGKGSCGRLGHGKAI